MNVVYTYQHLLNKAHTGHMLAPAWFLKIVSVQTSVCVCMCVFVSTPEANNNMMWHDMAWYGPHMIGQTSSTAVIWQL